MTFKAETKEELCDVLIVGPLNEGSPIVDIDDNDEKMEASEEVKDGDEVVVEGPTTGSEPVLNIKVKFPASKKRSFSCNYCNLSFSDFRALGGHQNAHKRERDREFVQNPNAFYQSPPLAYRHYSPMFSSALNTSSPLNLRIDTCTNRSFPLGLQMGSYSNGTPFIGSNNRINGSFSSTISQIMPLNYVPPQPLYSSTSLRSFGEYHANINGGSGRGNNVDNVALAPPFRFPAGSSRNHGGGVLRYLSEPPDPHSIRTMDAGFLNLGNGPVHESNGGGGELDLDLKL